MYKISIPVVITDRKNFVKEDTLKMLKTAGAQRVFLALGVPSFDKSINTKNANLLKELIPYFREKGFEVGVWIWTFWKKELTPDFINENIQVNSLGKQRLTTETLASNQNISSGFCCPSAPQFVKDATDFIKEIASYNPDIIMFDDDYRFGHLGGFGGCYCKHHLKAVSKKLERDITREELFKKVYEGKPNIERNAFYDALGESMESFAVKVREAIDSVNPKIRMAICAVLSLWDNDGTNCIKIAKLLAGNTKPIMRLIGAPYWPNCGWNMSLNSVIELERMESSWVGDEDIEIMTEGDVYPRPRHIVPSANLEIFDTILRASDVGNGILKYMIDYTSSAEYETGYIKHHNKNEFMYNQIDRVFGDKEAIGIRVYESMEKARYADFSGIENADEYAENMFHSYAGRFIANCSLPTRYSGTNGIGIAFGENARNLPQDAFNGGLILDIRGAKILMEQGIDVGVESIGENIKPDLIYYPDQNEYVRGNYGGKSFYKLTVNNNARIVAYAVTDDGNIPDTFAYENKNGQKFLVLGYDVAFTDDKRHLNYCTRDMLYKEYKWLSGKDIPVKTRDNPYTYVLCKKNETETAIGIWNIFEDEMFDSVIELDKEYTECEIVGANGKLDGDKVIIESLPAYKFCFIRVK